MNNKIKRFTAMFLAMIITISGLPLQAKATDTVTIKTNGILGRGWVQETILLNDTLINNLFLNTDDNHPSNERLLKKLFSHLHYEGFMEELDKNIYADRKLSTGEKQKISIMRTFLKNPDIFIFDEPTSALDKDSIKGFNEMLDRYCEKKIILLVTHDARLIKVCDYIVEIKQ